MFYLYVYVYILFFFFSGCAFYAYFDEFLQKGPLCSDTIVGQGGTTAWKLCGLDKATSLCLMFEIVKKEIPDATVPSASNQFYFQFLT